MLSSVLIFASVIILTHSACIVYQELPVWKDPCRNTLTITENAEIQELPKETLIQSLTAIKLCLNKSVFNCKRYNFSNLYKNLMSQPYDTFKWLPSKNDINMDIQNTTDIINELPNVYINLQKFAMIFDAMLYEETLLQKKYMKEFLADIRELLCEIHDFLIEVPTISEEIPNEFKLTENTDQHIRDYEVTRKYYEYLRKLRNKIKKLLRNERNPGDHGKKRKRDGRKKKNQLVTSRM